MSRAPAFGAPSAAARSRIEALLGARVREAVPTGGGYSPAARWRVRTAGGERVFVKLARSEYTCRALRHEHAVLRGFAAGASADPLADFAPRLVAFEDDAAEPLLVIEDLGDARWPPPWDDALVLRVRETLARVHARTTSLPPFSVVHAGESHGWALVAAEPAPFLALGLVTRAWLDASLPALCAAEASAALDGDALVHFDVRSDNLCLAERGVVLVDWSLACRGRAEVDLGFWLPSLEMEGGPPPERFLPHHPDVAAWVSGFFAARAGLPVIAEAPGVRDVQLRQLRTALPWAVRALGLRPPG